MDKWNSEIMQVEKDFATMALEQGVARAFVFFAAPDAVLMRNNRIIQGKEEIRQYFEKSISSKLDDNLTWKPDFVHVSQSGDLAYTFGNYKFTSKDSLGKTMTKEGIFHTVWKRQSNGEWKFVWD
jgi:ketosteroid isomerase-like protein